MTNLEAQRFTQRQFVSKILCYVAKSVLLFLDAVATSVLVNKHSSGIALGPMFIAFISLTLQRWCLNGIACWE